MPNPINLLELSFLKQLPHFELAVRLLGIADAVAVHPGFQEDFPKTVPDAKELKETGTYYNVLSTAALSGDRGKMAERDAFRPRAVQLFALTLTWAAMRSIRENNPNLIVNLGVDQKKKSLPRSTVHALVGAPKDPQAKQGPTSGTVTFNVLKVQGGITYIVQACQGDPTREESWSKEWQSAKRRGIHLTGLEPGKMYYFRVRCFCHAGYGPWSSIVSLMVI